MCPRQLARALENGGVFLEFDEGGQLLQDLRGIQLAVLAGEDAFDVMPIEGAIGEGLVHEKIFGGADEERHLVGVRSADGALDPRPASGELHLSAGVPTPR